MNIISTSCVDMGTGSTMRNTTGLVPRQKSVEDDLYIGR
jgi:hypothetical protein